MSFIQKLEIYSFRSGVKNDLSISIYSYAIMRVNKYANNQKLESVEKIKKFVYEKNGECFIENYKNNMSTFLCKCCYGHQWYITWSNMQSGKWCPTCSKNKKLTLDDAKQIAKKHNGELLSVEYKNSRTKLHWKCANGHDFLMNVNAINSRGHWCPYCSFWSGEEICRVYFQSIFKQKFLRVRPNWLLNSRGNRMELDGLSSSKIDGYYLSFEHQGEQHYKSTNVFPGCSTESDLILRKFDDETKRVLCKNNNVILIEIPQLFKLTKINDLKKMIKSACENKIILPDNFDSIEIDYSNMYSNNVKLEEIKDIIQNNGGICLSDKYINSTMKLNIKCGNKHIFELSPNNIKNGRWCPYCPRRRRNK